jgi:hypothetical protein
LSTLTRGHNGIVLPLLYLAGLLLAVGFLLSGIFLDLLLARRVHLLKYLLYATIGVSLVRGTVIFLFNPAPLAFIVPIAGVLIGVYLLANVGRLARENPPSDS